MNSLKLVLTVALISSFVGVLLSYILKTKSVKFKSIVNLIGFLPEAVPGIIVCHWVLTNIQACFIWCGKIYS